MVSSPPSETKSATPRFAFDEEMLECKEGMENNVELNDDEHIVVAENLGGKTANKAGLASNLIIDEDCKMSSISILMDEIHLLRERVEDVENIQHVEKIHHTRKTLQYGTNLKAEERFSEYVSENASDEDDDEEGKYPEDCYSFIALNGLHQDVSYRRRTISFCFGLMVFMFQIMLLFLLLAGGVHVKLGTVEESGNPWSSRPYAIFAQFVPPNAKRIVRASQVISLLAYVIFPCSSQHDVAKAIQFFPAAKMKDCKAVIFYQRLACILRGFQGICSAITVWVLVATSSTVVDIILNFTAVAFVSSLDDESFELAKKGVFGTALRDETKRIANTRLPQSMYKRTRKIWHWYWITMALTAFLVGGVQIYVMSAQKSSVKWVTKQFRIQFNDDGYRKYSGCYGINEETSYHQRYTYHSIRDGSNSSIGYCLDDREWHLFDGNSYGDNICRAKEEGLEHSKTLPTDSFDISATFDLRWLSTTGTPLDMYFFEGEEDDELLCDINMGDGKCDEEFNQEAYYYDGGDCCAHTCEGIKCGRGAMTDVFGVTGVTGDGYPRCKDSKMVSLTLHVNNLTSSREHVDTSNWLFMGRNETVWRNETPDPTFLSIECNERAVLTVDVTTDMRHKNQTLMVEDGSNCKMIVKNNTGIIDPSSTWLRKFSDADGSDFLTSTPIWHIDYSIFHEATSSTHNEKIEIEILNQRSDREGKLNFTLFPQCFLKQLQNLTTITTIYNSELGSSEKAARWLAGDSERISRCGEAEFIDRYVLADMNFALTDKQSSFVEREDHCTWPSVTCDSSDRVTGLKLPQKGLKGGLPSSIGYMTTLKHLKLGYNEIASIPTEIGLLTNLEHMELVGNNLTSIPTEIGSLPNMKYLALSNNEEVTSLPTEIGLIKTLKFLIIDSMGLSSFPTEIGLLTELSLLFMGGNSNASVPEEIYELQNLTVLDMFGMELSTIPSEISLLSKLDWLAVWNNPITSIPTEIGLLKDLERFSLDTKNLSSFPSEMNSLTKLREVNIGDQGARVIFGSKQTNNTVCDVLTEQLDIPCLGVP